MISPRPATIAKTPAATIPHSRPCSPLSAVFMGWPRWISDVPVSSTTTPRTFRQHREAPLSSCRPYTLPELNGSGSMVSCEPKPHSVRMKAPPGVSTLYTIDGRRVTIGTDGIVELTEREAAPLKLTAGWQRLDDAV